MNVGDRYRNKQIIEYKINGEAYALLPNEELVLCEHFKGQSSARHCVSPYFKMIIVKNDRIIKLYKDDFDKLEKVEN